jgi:hypothetical protein
MDTSMRFRPASAKMVFFLERRMATEPTGATANQRSDPYQLDRRLTILETRFDTILPTLATKADLAELKGDLRAEFKTTLHQEMNSLERWLIALTISMLLGFATMVITMINLLRP